MRGRLAALLAAGAIACPPSEPPRPPPEATPAGDDAALPDPAAAPVNRAAGETVVLTAPRVDGAGLDLRELRGKAVIVELTASWATGWPEIVDFYREVLAPRRGEVAVVLVVMDGERDALAQEPGGLGPDLALCWDPQGAVAAQLQAAAIPTVLVLDRAGRLVAAMGAEARSPQRIRDALSSALAAP